VTSIQVVAAIVEREGSYLLTRRQAGTHLEGMWEFPGGKVHAGETHEVALRREMREELDVDVRVAELLLTTAHAYPERRVTLHFYRCMLEGLPAPQLGQEMRWTPRAELTHIEFPEADRDLVRMLSGA
jgi:8-oxo-dGTP diphosphatase